MKRPRVLLLNLSVSDAAAQVIKWLHSLNHRASINKDSGVSGFFDNLNGCLDIRLYKIMVPIVKTLPSYIKEIQYALEIFRDFNFLGQNKFVFTINITSLKAVIPNDEGLWALKHFFDQCTVKEPCSETLLRLAELVLTLNCFSLGL